ncbi:TIGR03086 family protein [Phycicoccus sp. HDW14]|nr:TIGR03086 family protein [Phycicoccus sp. HDW14]
MHDLTSQIERALDVLRPIVDGIHVDDWGQPTPCVDWDVREVLNHTVGGMRIFAAELTGQQPPADHDSDWLGDNPTHAFEVAAALDADAWGGPLSPEQMVTISLGRLPLGLAAVIHLTELVAHGADLACATGQQHLLDEELCAGLLEAMHAMGGVDDYRMPGVFDPAVTARPDAAPHEQLAAYLGRDLSVRVTQSSPTQA